MREDQKATTAEAMTPEQEWQDLLCRVESAVRQAESRARTAPGGSNGSSGQGDGREVIQEVMGRINELRSLLHAMSPMGGGGRSPGLPSGLSGAGLSGPSGAMQPVDFVRWVPLAMVSPNDYNPNSVAKIEMRLLHSSIYHDGYTQPCVTYWDAEAVRGQGQGESGKGLYIIVDGFHRYHVMKTNRDIYDRCYGLLPIVVIDKILTERMASTVRHNRARGKHSVTGMSNLVFQMLAGGMTDEEVCNELGMSPEEILRLKHITGFSKLFSDVEYSKSWQTQRQIRIARQYQESQASASSKPGASTEKS